MRLLYSVSLALLCLPAVAQQRTSAKQTASQSAAHKAAPAPASSVQASVTVPAVLPPSVQKLDAHYGFRDAKLEVDSLKMSGLVYDRHDSNLYFYHRTNDSLSLGTGGTMSATSYAFYRGKLLSITFTTQGAKSSHNLLERLQELYGPGEQKKPDQPRYVWRGEKAMLRYDESSTNNNATVTLISLPLTERRQQDAQEVNQRTAANR